MTPLSTSTTSFLTMARVGFAEAALSDLGTPRRDASGAITNGVLLLHGTAGSAADLVQANFFDALYGAGEPLDLSRYFLVIPDVIGAGDSSKPSDGLHAHFPRYGYKDQVRAQHLLLEKIGIKAPEAGAWDVDGRHADLAVPERYGWPRGDWKTGTVCSRRCRFLLRGSLGPTICWG
jgi:hypothetical protein